MSSMEEDAALARSRELQLQLIIAAYEADDDEVFEQALYRVTTVRRMLSSGILEFIEEAAKAEDHEDGGDGGDPDS